MHLLDGMVMAVHGLLHLTCDHAGLESLIGLAGMPAA